MLHPDHESPPTRVLAAGRNIGTDSRSRAQTRRLWALDDRYSPSVLGHLWTGSLPAARRFQLVDWKQLDFPTRAGLVATVMAVLGALIPPISVMSALVGTALSGTAVHRAHRRRQPNPVARLCLVVSVALVVMIIVGSAIYSGGN